MPMIPHQSATPANAGAHEPGLSPNTLKLWLAATRYRRLADALAATDKRTLNL